MEKHAMEEILSLAANEERERKIFMQDLNRFMGEVGKPLSKIPIMGYKELDLFQLFKEVTAYGGFNEVVKNVGTWSKIWKRLGNFDPSITDSSFRLKRNYERYLLEYEYTTFPDHRKQAIEMEKQLKKSPSCDSLPSSPEAPRIPKTERTKPKKIKKKTSPSPHSPSSWKNVIKKVMGRGNVPDETNLSLSGTRYSLSGAQIIQEFATSNHQFPIEMGLSTQMISSPPSSPLSFSPTETRKRKSSRECSDEELKDERFSNKQQKLYVDYENNFSARNVQFSTREEIDALESAVATLNALKYCVVF